MDPDWRGEEVKDPTATGWVSVSCPRPDEESSIQEDMKTLWDRVKERNRFFFQLLSNIDSIDVLIFKEGRGGG